MHIEQYTVPPIAQCLSRCRDRLRWSLGDRCDSPAHSRACDGARPAAQTGRRRCGRFLAQWLALMVVAGAFDQRAAAANDGGILSSVLQANVRREVHTPTPALCRELVQDAGRMIAWARWEEGFSLEKTRSAPFPADTPPWIVVLVQDWITDAYQWQATDEQIFQWASELGNVEDLPQADQLSRHETIAIWLRRIARQCTARSG